MARWRKSLSKLLQYERDRSFDFHELRGLLRRLGFQQLRVSGSHHIFSKAGCPEIVNLQPRADGSAKPYQVRQVRALILRYGLHLNLEDR